MACIKRTVALRLCFITSMIIAAIIFAIVAYTVVSKLEESTAVNTYESIAVSAITRAKAIAQRKQQGGQVLASVLGYAFSSSQDWPFIGLRGYHTIAEKVAKLSSTAGHGLTVIVKPEQVVEFEQHAQQLYQEFNYPETAGYSDFGFGIYKTSPDESTYDDGRVHDITGNTTWNSNIQILAPFLQHSNTFRNPNLLLMNLHASEFRGRVINSIIECSEIYKNDETWDQSISPPNCGVVTDFTTIFVRPGPSAVFFQPIYPIDDPTNVVGFIGTSINWAEVLDSIVPNYVDGLHCIVCNDNEIEECHTYVIHNGVPELVGNGDLHNPSFDEYKHTVKLNDEFDTTTLTDSSGSSNDGIIDANTTTTLPVPNGAKLSRKYTLTVYPTDEMFNEFRSRNPVYMSIGFVLIVGLCTGLFFLYDYFIKIKSHQRKKILEVKRRFVRFISHEIRTPLNVVCMGLELLQQEIRSTIVIVTPGIDDGIGGGGNGASGGGGGGAGTVPLATAAATGMMKRTGSHNSFLDMSELTAGSKKQMPGGLGGYVHIDTTTTTTTAAANDVDAAVGGGGGHGGIDDCGSGDAAAGGSGGSHGNVLAMPPPLIATMGTTPSNGGTTPHGLEETDDGDKKKHASSSASRKHHHKKKLKKKRKTSTSAAGLVAPYLLDLTGDILENALNAVSVLNDLLSYDKIETGTFKLELGKVDIWRLLHKTVSEFSIQARNRKIELRITSDAGYGIDGGIVFVDEELSLKSSQNNSLGGGGGGGGLPPTGTEFMDLKTKGLRNLHVLGDDVRLSQVIRNLTSNAIKFSPEGGVVTVTANYVPNGLPDAESLAVMSSSSGGRGGAATTNFDTSEKRNAIAETGDRSGSIKICIQDNGPGLTLDQIGRLFREGVQFDANKLQAGGGSGLGLAITKEIIEQHQGSIVATSEGKGMGATFAMELPMFESSPLTPAAVTAAVPPTAAAAAAVQPIKHASSDGGDSGTVPSSTEGIDDDDDDDDDTHHVLVVDDVISNTKMLVRLLERQGHTCQVARNGQEAIDAFVESEKSDVETDMQFDTILMDFEMPVMNGPTATRQLRDLGCKAYIIGVTGNVLAEDVAVFKGAGADHVLPKPVNTKAIESCWANLPPVGYSA